MNFNDIYILVKLYEFLISELIHYSDAIVHSFVHSAPGNRKFGDFRKNQINYLKKAQKMAIKMKSKLVYQYITSALHIFSIIGTVPTP